MESSEVFILLCWAEVLGRAAPLLAQFHVMLGAVPEVSVPFSLRSPKLGVQELCSYWRHQQRIHVLLQLLWLPGLLAQASSASNPGIPVTGFQGHSSLVTLISLPLSCKALGPHCEHQP